MGETNAAPVEWILGRIPPPSGPLDASSDGPGSGPIGLIIDTDEPSATVTLPPNGVNIPGIAFHRELQDGDRDYRICSIAAEEVLDPGLEKIAREELQVIAFQGACPDFRAATLEPGGDPPDFLLRTTEGAVIALELTQFTLPAVRQELARLQVIESHIEAGLRSPAHDHLAFTRICVDLRSFPTRRGESAVVAEVLQSVESAVGTIDADSVARMGQSDELPEGIHQPAQLDGIIRIEESVEHAPRAMVRLVTGIAIRGSEILEELTKLISSKDVPENDVLLISTGAPAPNGFTCPADVHLFVAVVDMNYQIPFTPRHLQRVYLHNWSTFDFIQLYPPGLPNLGSGGLFNVDLSESSES